MRNTYTRYHICLMRVFILLLSIRYNVCVCHNPVYHYITATAVYLTQRFARYHICLMRVFIILLSIRYNVCVCYDPVYYYITATAVCLTQRFITTCVDDISRMTSHCMYCVL